MMMRPALTVFIFTLLFNSLPLYAHRGPKGLTTIKRSSNTGSIEIIHRLHTHDVEQVLATILKADNITLESIEGRARLALYVERSFEIRDQSNGNTVELTLLGAEQEGDYLYVYQEREEALPNSLAIRHDALREIYADQVNTLTIAIDAKIRSLTFSKEDKWKTLK